MKLTTKKILSFMILAGVMCLPMLAGAQFQPTREAGATNLSTNSFYDVVVTIMNYLLVLITILAVIGFIISGILFITAAGTGKADTAKDFLVYSIIGVVVALIGYIIVQLIDGILRGNPATS